MFKVFLKGFVFGLGAIAAVVATWIAFALSTGAPSISFSSRSNIPTMPAASADASVRGAVRRDFGDMTIDEQIASSSVIFITRFEPAEDGRRKAVITEILKSPSDGSFDFEVGDEYARLSTYSEDPNEYGDGYVTFMTGDPPDFRMSSNIREERIGGFGGIPLDVLRKKILGA